MRKYNTGYEDGNYGLSLGHVEANEQFSEAARREIREETGVEVSDEGFTEPSHVMSRRRDLDSQRVDVFFLVNNWEGEPKIKEADKCNHADWYPVNDLPSNTIPYIEHAIVKITEEQDLISWSEFDEL